MIDEASRFTAARVVANREYETIKEALNGEWFRHFHRPQEIISDREGAFDNEKIGEWLHNLGVKLHLKARGQHAHIVERHHELLRQQLHLLEGQATSDGLKISFAEILQEAVLAKNCLVNVGGFSPYQAVYGRTPPLLDAVEAAFDEPEDRASAKLRELAISSMVQATAKERARIAASTKTRVSGELLALVPGDLVEFHRPKHSKDVSGWKGPAIVTDVTNLERGQVAIRWQSGIIFCRVPDIRRALMYPIFLSQHSINTPMEELYNAAGKMSDVMRFGWVHKEKWMPCTAYQQQPRTLAAGLHAAAYYFHLEGCIGFRIGRGAHKLEAVSVDDGLLLWWLPGQEMNAKHCFHNPAQRINLEHLFGERWRETCFIQFLVIDSDEAASALEKFFDPHAPRSTEVSSEDGGMKRQYSDASSHNPSPMQANKTNPRDDDMKRRWSDASSHNPSPAAAPRLDSPRGQTEEEKEQVAQAESEDSDSFETTSDLQAQYADSDVETDADLDAYYHLLAADTIAMEYDWHPPDAAHHWPGEHDGIIEADDSPCEVAFTHKAAAFLAGSRQLADDEELIVSYHADGSHTAVIEKVNNVLTREEALKRPEECKTAILEELGRWHKHGAWERFVVSRTTC